jgi:hypothetical protein
MLHSYTLFQFGEYYQDKYDVYFVKGASIFLRMFLPSV